MAGFQVLFDFNLVMPSDIYEAERTRISRSCERTND